MQIFHEAIKAPRSFRQTSTGSLFILGGIFYGEKQSAAHCLSLDKTDIEQALNNLKQHEQAEIRRIWAKAIHASR